MVAGESAWVKAARAPSTAAAAQTRGMATEGRRRGQPVPIERALRISVTGMKCAKRS
jgi:hypothetical protein